MKTYNFLGYAQNDLIKTYNVYNALERPEIPVEEPGSTTGTREIREDSEWKHRAFNDEEEEEETEDKNDDGDYEEEDTEEE